MAESALTKHPHGKRRYQSVAEGVSMAQEFLRSGLTMGEFARQNDVSYRMVKYWSARMRQLAAASETAAEPRTEPRLLEHVAAVSNDGNISLAVSAASAPPTVAVITTADPPATIEVRLVNGMRLAIQPGFSATLLKQVIQALEGRGAC